MKWTVDDYISRIPDGHRRAMSRPSSPYKDREMRERIREMNENGDCIINVNHGYFRPIPGDPADESFLNTYLKREKKRAVAIMKKIVTMKRTYEAWKEVAIYAKQQAEGKEEGTGTCG